MADLASEQGFTMFVQVTIKAGRVDEFLQHYQPMLRKIATEPGFLSIEVFHSEENANRLCWVENWNTSKTWFREQILTRPYVRQYLDSTKPLCDGERSMTTWNRLGGDYAVAKKGVYREPSVDTAE
ncbi:hypothetical protein B0J12DRAFT_742223 [Macrophomina phaseolina]|uniref:ABM domain-containing protein n=1 Tax=Macrophomina phaseolina TaxID=35725 RepID=A0ABQ8G5F8_9PEZI|nr:hypothetical protein B0J12DRAFT_742223 [Macrophomina phaseolina]